MGLRSLWFHGGIRSGLNWVGLDLLYVRRSKGGSQLLTIKEVLLGPPSLPPPVLDELISSCHSDFTAADMLRITFIEIRVAGFCLFLLAACNFSNTLLLPNTVAAYFSFLFVSLKPMDVSWKLDHGWDSVEWVVGVKPFPAPASLLPIKSIENSLLLLVSGVTVTHESQ